MDAKFISDKQRHQLEQAKQIIEQVKSKLTIEHEEFVAIDSTLDYLQRAIRMEKNFY